MKRNKRKHSKKADSICKRKAESTNLEARPIEAEAGAHRARGRKSHGTHLGAGIQGNNLTKLHRQVLF